ncbi:hypothetical protein KFE25_005871 [Diacronema lutheri]|uniref:Uncharacterized protein n=1 Tax=Diacronema lutheri TaxID=2081491 RepID=A0A8J6CFS4_DIALT|nr:hypothetical protein KFE25_005871 [Diacronema lutheri]
MPASERRRAPRLGLCAREDDEAHFRMRAEEIRPDACLPVCCTLSPRCSLLGASCARVFAPVGAGRELAALGVFKYACTPCCSVEPLLTALEAPGAHRPCTHVLMPDGGSGYKRVPRVVLAVSLKDELQLPEPLPAGAARPPESSGLHPLFPYLGAGGQPFALLAPHANPVYVKGGHSEARLPKPSAVFDAVLARSAFEPCPRGANSLTSYFALLVAHELVRTDVGRAAGSELAAVATPATAGGRTAGSDGGRPPPFGSADGQRAGVLEERPWINAASSFLDLQSVYGGDTLSALRVRALVGGQLRDEEGTGATGARTLRLPVVAALLRLFRAEHNVVARELAAREPRTFGVVAGRRGEEACFQAARRVTTAIFAQIVLGDFLPAAAGAPRWALGRALANARPFRRTEPVPSHVSAELKLLLQLHAAIPDGWEHGAGGAAAAQPARAAAGGGVGAQPKHDDGAVLGAAMRAPSGRLGAQHAPRYLKAVEERAVRWSRAMGMPSFNAARVALGLPALSSWDELRASPAVTAKLASLYPGGIADLEISVGAAVEASATEQGWSIGVTALTALRAQCVASVLGDRFLTVELTAEALTPWGLQRVLTTTRLAELIERHAPIGEALSRADNVWSVHRASARAMVVGVEAMARV